MLLPSVPLVLLHDFEATRGFCFVLSIGCLLEQTIKLEFVLVGDFGIACFGLVKRDLRVGGSSLMYLSAYWKVSCIGSYIFNQKGVDKVEFGSMVRDEKNKGIELEKVLKIFFL